MNFDTKLTRKYSSAPWPLCAGQIAHSIHYIEGLWDPEPFAIVCTRERFLNLAGAEPRFIGFQARSLVNIPTAVYMRLWYTYIYIYTHTYRHLAAKVGTSKGGGKQWQTTPKNLLRMQCARAIPIT